MALKAVEQRAVETYKAKTPSSAALFREAQVPLPGGDTRSATFFLPHPLFMDHGEGPRVFDVDGNSYIDLLNNYSAQIHGNSHPLIQQALLRQASKGVAFAAPLEINTQLAKIITNRIPAMDQLRFCNSGTEAVMMALRGARALTGRNKILKFEGAYHGTYDATEISVMPYPFAGPDSAPHSIPESPGLMPGVAENVIVAPFNDIEATAKLIEKHSLDLAAVLVEPLVSRVGMPANAEFLKFLRSQTRQTGSLLIFDEIQTFRLCHGGLQEVYGIDPDMTTLGKIIGGGLPIGAFGGTQACMAIFDPRNTAANKIIHHSGTGNGNAMAMAAGIAAMDLLPRGEIERLNALADSLRRKLEAEMARHAIEGLVMGYGSLMNIAFGPRTNNSQNLRALIRSNGPTSLALYPLLHYASLNEGLFFNSKGYLNLSTPMNEAVCDDVVARFCRVFAQMAPAYKEVVLRSHL